MNRPRVLQVYNEYRRYGGEDTVVLLEAEMLRRRGHAVESLRVSTKELDGAGYLRLAAAGFATAWSTRGYSAMMKAIRTFSPHIVHVHNEFPLLSPSIFWACHRAGVPVAQTMHNYRFACANALLLRGDRPCEDCVGRFPWPALQHRCYGSSLPRTFAVTARNILHRALDTYRHKVHAYIVLTEFSKELFVRAGLPPERVFVKPNFQTDTGKPALPRTPTLVFAGGLYRFKGLHLLLQAWSELRPAGQQLLIIGDGPERLSLERQFPALPGLVWCGAQSREKVLEQIAMSRFVVLPSLAYENFPMSVLEALSAGTPVIVPDHGAFAKIISNGNEGLQFSAGNSSALAATLRAALSVPEAAWQQWSTNARNKYLREYTEESNYPQLMAIYQEAMASFQRQRSRATQRKAADATAPAARELQRDS